MANFRASLLRRCDEAIAVSAATPKQRARAKELRKWAVSLIARIDDATAEKIAEHAFIVGAALERLIASNYEPWIDSYMRSLQAASRGGEKKRANQRAAIQARDAEIDSYVASKLKAGHDSRGIAEGLATLYGKEMPGVELGLSDESLRKRVSTIKRALTRAKYTASSRAAGTRS